MGKLRNVVDYIKNCEHTLTNLKVLIFRRHWLLLYSVRNNFTNNLVIENIRFIVVYSRQSFSNCMYVQSNKVLRSNNINQNFDRSF